MTGIPFRSWARCIGFMVMWGRAAAQSPSPSARADTVVVRSTGAGLWGPGPRAVVSEQVGGGHDTVAFGDIESIAALGDGGVAVFDTRGASGPALLEFDSLGRFRRQLGRTGGGPGEYGDRAFIGDLVADPRGGLVFLDRAHARVDRWDAAGISAPPAVLPFYTLGSPPVLAGPGGSIYVAARFGAPHQGWLVDPSVTGLVHLDSAGRIQDSVPPQHSWLATAPLSQFGATTSWTVLPTGAIVVTGTDQLALLIRQPGSLGVLRAEQSFRRVPVSDQERDEYTALRNWEATEMRGMPALPDLPRVKAATWGITGIDPAGAIWLQLHTAAMPVAAHPAVVGHFASPPPMIRVAEPLAFAVFRFDGTYLGTVSVPAPPGLQFSGDRVGMISFSGRVIWAVMRDGDGVEALVKWRTNTRQ